MSDAGQMAEREPVYVMVSGVESLPYPACARTSVKELLRGEEVLVSQVVIEGKGEAEDYGVSETVRCWYVLDGKAILRGERADAHVSRGCLIVIPPGVSWGPCLSLVSDRLTALDIAARAGREDRGSHPDAGQDRAASVIRPEDVPSYLPAGHSKTVNRCLYIDDRIEIIEGTIEVGGGAQRHLHRHHEQVLYLLETSNPLLIYYPKGAPHGTEGGVSSRLKLLVIYSPPLGESQNALKE